VKEEKFRHLVDEIEEFIGLHERSNPHYLFDETIIEVFAQYKKKHIKRAITELR
jgi:hypothetical protein